MRVPHLSALLVFALVGCGTSWVSDDVDGDGKSISDGDCNDFDSGVFGGAAEIWYDGVDQDCDGNDGDKDGDGYYVAGYEELAGIPVPEEFNPNQPDCWDDPDTTPEEYTALNGATQPQAANVNAGSVDSWYDGVDADCSGNDDFDQDGDGHASSAFSEVRSALPVDDCYDNEGDGYPATDTACDTMGAELDPALIYGGAADDPYDGTDADCAGDDDFDADGDGYQRCEECDDTDAALFPSGLAESVWYDGIDDNCDGNDGDQDGDGYYVDGYIALATAAGAVDPVIPDFYVSDVYDCWDDPTDIPDEMTALNDLPQLAPDEVHPREADEEYEDTSYDGIDADCAGDSDFDHDGDGGDTTEYPNRAGAYGLDCDDEDGSINYGAAETWYDGVDGDCAGGDDYDQDQDGYRSDNYIVDGVRGTDCDDDAEGYDINPGMNENCSTAEDDNCDGSTNLLDADNCTVYYLDEDGDLHATDDHACYCVPTDDYTVTAISDTDDCNDADATINPDVTEVTADGVDNDCDNKEQCYVDADADHYGSTSTNENSSDLDCADAGEADNADDCDDNRNTVYPGATETIANGRDDSCDGIELCYADTDKDGFGDTSTVNSADVSCTTAAGEADDNEDCDDSDSAVNPDEEDTVANGVDDNCDGTELCYTDGDQDGYGSTVPVESADLSCTTAASESSNADDCNDTVALVSPGATEVVANGVDDDCNGFESCYVDADKDGYGDESGAVVASADLYCIAASGEANDTDDCDDSTSAVNPSVTEIVSNRVDDDCDSLEACYVDTDHDTYGSTTTAETSVDLDCSDVGEADDDDDCNDAVAAVNPGASEVTANSIDDDCDNKEQCYVDSDGDHYGTTSTSETSTDLDCSDTGEASVSTDCNDALAVVNPGATETVANSRDDDCDGLEACYTDSDHDGYGSTSSTEASTDTACSAVGESSVSTDCNDASSAVSPAATEAVANSTDDNCDGVELCYVDADKDTYGTSAGTTVASADTVCSYLLGEADDILDCNDGSSAIKPSATETVGDSVDYNCDNKETCYVDSDKDGYGNESGTTVVSTTDTLCSTANSEADDILDCDDTTSLISPAASEVAVDGVDQNCDDKELCYTDADYDTFGSDTTALVSDLTCSTTGYANDTDDCDDTSSSVKPTATETVANSKDDDCDGLEACYVDSDADHYGTTTTAETSTDTDCSDSGEASVSTDCDDTRNTVYLGATEVVANGRDESCDGYESCYLDADLDTYGGDSTGLTTSLTCSASGYADDTDDCDDTSSYTKPGATELCDGKQNNCSASWTAASENDKVSFESGTGAWSDVTSSFSTGTSSAAAAVVASADGTYHMCSRTTGDAMWWASLNSSGYDVTLDGRPSSGTNPVMTKEGLTGALLATNDGLLDVEDMTLVGGLGSGSGAYGGVLIGTYTADVTFTNCDIEGGEAASGARIALRYGADLTLENTTLTAGDVTASATYGSAISITGGTTTTYSTVSISNSTITDNLAENGTIYLDGDGAVSCSNSDIMGNTANLYGGALYFDHASKGTFVSTNCTYGNTSAGLTTADIARDPSYTFDAAADADGTFTCGATCL